MSESLVIVLHKRRDDLEQSVFEFPPSTWDEFQRRLGQWIELTNLINELERLAQEQTNES
jgi:hypothetical protein